MYQLTNNPEQVIDLDTGAVITVDSGTWQADQYAEWLAEGNTPLPYDDPTMTPDAQLAARESSAQAWLDTTAQQNFYDDAERCVSYAGSTNETYAADAVAMSSWRDALWPAFYAASATWPDDVTAWPTWDALQAQLPQPGDYGWTLHDPVGLPPGVTRARP